MKKIICDICGDEARDSRYFKLIINEIIINKELRDEAARQFDPRGIEEKQKALKLKLGALDVCYFCMLKLKFMFGNWEKVSTMLATNFIEHASTMGKEIQKRRHLAKLKNEKEKELTKAEKDAWNFIIQKLKES